jgi:hypothetical protein
LHVHTSILAPSAWFWPTTSRHNPVSFTVIVPSLLIVHCWFGPPLQSQTSTFIAKVCLPLHEAYGFVDC